jgi:hypothetical protein
MTLVVISSLALIAPVGLLAGSPVSAEPPPDVSVTNADDGRVVHLVVGQRLQVRLEAPGQGEVWDVQPSASSDTGPLFLEQLWAGATVTTATYLAMKPSADAVAVTGSTDQACRHTDPTCAAPSASWGVQVLVDDAGQPQGATCQQVAQPSPGPGVTLLEARDNGRTVTVRVGEVVAVYLGCSYLVPQGGGPLFRQSAARGHGSFRAEAVGTVDVTDQTDLACFHAAQPCAQPSALWRATVQVVAAGDGPCVGGELTAPATVRIGSTVSIRGNATAGSRVEVWFRRRGETAFTLRRVLTADANGLFATAYVATDDHRYYARVGDCSSALELTVVRPTISGPAAVPRGATVALTAHGIPGFPVRIGFLREVAGAQYEYRRSGRFSDRGTYTTSYVGSATYRYLAVQGTGSGQRSSDAGRTVAR